MSFQEDLDRVTAGDYASHYLDDDEFNYAVEQMEELGHDPEKAADALRDWIDQSSMWDCDECGKENIDDDYSACPVCDTESFPEADPAEEEAAIASVKRAMCNASGVLA